MNPADKYNSMSDKITQFTPRYLNISYGWIC